MRRNRAVLFAVSPGIFVITLALVLGPTETFSSGGAGEPDALPYRSGDGLPATAFRRLEPYGRLVIKYEFHWLLSLTLDLIFIASFFVPGGGFRASATLRPE